MKPTHRKNRFLLLQTSAALALLVNQATAGTTFNGNAAATTGNWDAAANWEGVLPTFNATTDLLFRNITATNRTTSLIASAKTVRSLTFNSNVTTGFEIRLTNGTNSTPMNLTMGDATNAAAITVNSDAAGNITIGKGSGTTGNDGDLILANDLAVAQNSANATLIIDRPITGAFALTKSGAGTLTLSGANTYTGATTVNAGTLSLGSGGTTGKLTATTSITNNGNLTINRSDAFSQATDLGAGIAITGAGSFTQAGAGTTTLTAANTYTGTTTLSAGTLNLGVAESVGVSGPLGNSAAANPGSIVLSGGTLQYSASNNHDYSGRFSTAASQSYNVNTNGQSVTWAANLTSSGGTLSKSGAGTVILTNANTYTGGTTVTAGTLSLGNGGTTGRLTATTAITNNGNLTINRSDAFSQATDLGAGVVISGSGSFTQAGAGTTTLTAANTYGGTTTLSAGTLRLQAAAGTLYYNTNQNYYINNGSTLVLATGTGTSPKIEGTVVNIDSNGGATITLDGINGLIQSSAGFTINSSGGAQNKLTSTGGAGFNAQLNDRPVIFNVTSGSNATADFLVTGGMGRSGITKSGNGKLLFTTGNVGTYGDGIETINIAGGVMEIGGSITLTQKSGMPFTNNGTFSWNSTANQTLANIISGSGALTKSNVGTLTLTGANTYTGDTTVSAGTLAVDGDSIANSGKLVIAGGKVDATGSETVGTLFFGATQQAAGTWGSSSSTAVPPFVDDTRFSGTGVVIVTSGPPGYAAWQTANSTVQAANLDHDNDGVSNGVEHFLGGTGNTTGFTTPLPGVTNTAGVLSVTWVRHPDFPDFPGNYGTAVIVETSATLADPWVPAVLGVGADLVEITGNNVKYTFPAGTKNFARLKVTPIP